MGGLGQNSDFSSCQKNRGAWYGQSALGGVSGPVALTFAPRGSNSCVATPPLPTLPPDIPPEPQVLGGKYTFSDYGAFVPLVYGSFIVTGNVFWQGNWRLHTFQRDNGPVQIYVTDFALGLCEGVINDVLRIWVGDVLVYDKRINVDNSNVPVPDDNGVLARATFNYGAESIKGIKIPSVTNLPELYARQMGIQTRFVVYNGSEYQMPPDKMVAIQGKENVPGYRGTAFIMFEDFFTGADSAPVIRVEVLANSEPRYARKFLTIPDNGFFTSVGEELAYDPTLDVLYVKALAASQINRGQFSIQASNMEFVGDHQWYATADSVSSISDDYFFEPILNGNIAVSLFEGNNGRIITGAPWGQTYLDSIEGASSIPTVHQSTGPAFVGQSSVAFNFLDDDDVPCTIMALTGAVGGSNCIGFMCAYEDGSLVWRGYLNNVLAQNQGGISNDTDAFLVPLIVDPDFAESEDIFPDLVRTEGGHLYGFTILNAGTAPFDVMYIDRITFADPPPLTQADAEDPNRATLEDPRHTYVGAISLDLIGGAGRNHQIIHAFLDPKDKCIVLTIKIGQTGESFSDRILKFNPFTNQFIYNKPLPASLDSDPCRGCFKGTIGVDGLWGYASPENKLVLVDLLYGDATVVVDDTDAEGIGDISAFASPSQAVWIGTEGALIIRISGTFGQPNLVKVWLTRTAGGTNTLGSIITDMLNRAGWDQSSLQIDTSVDTINVRGYAILNEMDVRTAISELKQVFGFDVVESNGSIQYLPRGGNPVMTIPYDHLKQDDNNGPLTEVIDTDIARLRKVSLKYFDVDRDYQENVQIGMLPEVNIAEFSAESAIDVSVPLALNAQEAKILAEGLAYQKSVYEANYQFSLPPKYQVLDPGDNIEIDEGTSTLPMRIRDMEIGADHEVRVNAVLEDSDIYNDTVDLFAAVGDFNDQKIPVPPAVMLFESLPIPCPSYLHMQRIEESDDSVGSRLGRIWYYDYNPTGATLTTDHSWQVKLIGGGTAGRSLANQSRPTWGYVTVPLESTGALYSTDTRSTMTVSIVETGDLTLNSLADLDTMIQNPTYNLACVGGEIIQFQSVTDNMDGTYTFTGFLRARVGTDAGARAQRRGNKFVLIADETGQFGPTNSQNVRGIGYDRDAQIERLSLTVTGQARRNPAQPTYFLDHESMLYKPWSPTGFEYAVSGGDLVLTWQKRERRADLWADDGAATLTNLDANSALGFQQRWEIFITDSAVTGTDAPTTFLRNVIVTDVNTWTYTAAMQTEDGVDITTDTLYAFVRFTGGKTGIELGWPGKFTMFPVQ